MGEESRGKGVNVALVPRMNLARAPAARRNWEGCQYCSFKFRESSLTICECIGRQSACWWWSEQFRTACRVTLLR